MLTLVHEDIYLYIDRLEEQKQIINSTTNATLINDSRQSVVDPGVITITVTSGSYTGVTVSSETDTLSIYKPLATNDVLVLDLRNRRYTLNGTPLFCDAVLDLKDDTFNIINISFTGTGNANIEYTRNQVVLNNSDLYFCTGLNVNQNEEILKTTNIKGKTRNRKTAKKEFTWGISGLWNETELKKFESSTGLFRFRLVDEEGTELETLANCMISSFQKSSSEDNDFTYSLDGTCEAIF